jgi:hypothetical protein
MQAQAARSAPRGLMAAQLVTLQTTYPATTYYLVLACGGLGSALVGVETGAHPHGVRAMRARGCACPHPGARTPSGSRMRHGDFACAPARLRLIHHCVVFSSLTAFLLLSPSQRAPTLWPPHL